VSGGAAGSGPSISRPWRRVKRGAPVHACGSLGGESEDVDYGEPESMLMERRSNIIGSLLDVGFRRPHGHSYSRPLEHWHVVVSVSKCDHFLARNLESVGDQFQRRAFVRGRIHELQ